MTGGPVATRCRLRRGRGSARFPEGSVVYARAEESDLRRWLREASDGFAELDQPQRVWVADDPTLERGCYALVSDLELPPVKLARRRR